MKYFKITIITPSLNQGKYIEETILSVINQDYSNLEYIVIDGGSTDGSKEIIKKYSNYLYYWESKPDSGQSSAINKGLNRANGEIVTWLNSDDKLMPGVLNKINKYFNDDANFELIYGRGVFYSEDTKYITTSILPNNINVDMLAKVSFPQSASFFKKSILSKIGYLNETLHFGMDYELYVQIALNYNVKQIDDIISKNLYHLESKSISKRVKFAVDWAKVFSKLLRSFDFTQNYINELISLGIYHNDIDHFSVVKKFTANEIKVAYLIFLQEQAQIYYGCLELKKANDIVCTIKKNDVDFFLNKKLNIIFYRSKYIPKFIFKLRNNYFKDKLQWG